MFFTVLMSLLIFSILMLLYWQRYTVVQTVSGWFNSRVSSAQSGAGGFRGQAVASVVLRMVAYTFLPLLNETAAPV